MGNPTSRARIRSALRILWLHSNERNEACKLAKYCCQKCGKKRSVKKGFEQKVEVHHKEGIGNWDKVIDLILDELLCDPEKLEVLCPDCHGEITNGTV